MFLFRLQKWMLKWSELLGLDWIGLDISIYIYKADRIIRWLCAVGLRDGLTVTDDHVDDWLYCYYYDDGDYY